MCDSGVCDILACVWVEIFKPAIIGRFQKSQSRNPAFSTAARAHTEARITADGCLEVKQSRRHSQKDSSHEKTRRFLDEWHKGDEMLVQYLQASDTLTLSLSLTGILSLILITSLSLSLTLTLSFTLTLSLSNGYTLILVRYRLSHHSQYPFPFIYLCFAIVCEPQPGVWPIFSFCAHSAQLPQFDFDIHAGSEHSWQEPRA